MACSKINLIATTSVNTIVLVPYGILYVLISFIGDFSPWPHALHGGLLCASGVCGAVLPMAVLGRLRPKSITVLIGVSLAGFNIFTLVFGFNALFDRANEVDIVPHLIRKSPIVLIPAINIILMIYILLFSKYHQDRLS